MSTGRTFAWGWTGRAVKQRSASRKAEAKNKSFYFTYPPSISPILRCLSGVRNYSYTSHIVVSTCSNSKRRVISAGVTYVSPLVTDRSILHALTLENCVLPGYYAASSGNLLPTFRDNLSIPSSGLNKKKMVLSETLVIIYHH
jgi:hypothetical protein